MLDGNRMTHVGTTGKTLVVYTLYFTFVVFLCLYVQVLLCSQFITFEFSKTKLKPKSIVPHRPSEEYKCNGTSNKKKLNINGET